MLIQVSSGNLDAILQFDRKNYQAPNLVKLLNDENNQNLSLWTCRHGYIKYYLKTETNNILDKIASKLARSYSDNHSLKH